MATKPLLLNETGVEQAQHLENIAASIDLMSKNMDRELVESDDIEDSAEDADDSVGNNVLLKSEQILTPEQKGIVRNNIGAASVESVINKIDKDTPVDDGVNYVYAQDASGNPIRILKSDMVSLIADAIKTNATEQAKVTFGASTIQALQTTIGTNLYGASTTDGLAVNVAQKIHDNANAQKLVTFGASDAAGLASVVAGEIGGFKMKFTDNCNNAIPSNSYFAIYLANNAASNRPSGSVDGYVVVLKWDYGVYCTQIFVDHNSNKVWIRSNQGSGFSSWKVWLT